jgi:hypothetical protein
MAMQAFREAWAVSTGVLATVEEVQGGPATMTLRLQVNSAPGQFLVQEEG